MTLPHQRPAAPRVRQARPSTDPALEQTAPRPVLPPIPPVTRSLSHRPPAAPFPPGTTRQAAHRIGRRQRLVEVLIGIPRGTLITQHAADELRALQRDRDHDVQVRDQQIAQLRRFLHDRGLATDYWYAYVANHAVRGEHDHPEQQ